MGKKSKCKGFHLKKLSLLSFSSSFGERKFSLKLTILSPSLQIKAPNKRRVWDPFFQIELVFLVIANEVSAWQQKKVARGTWSMKMIYGNMETLT